MTRMHKHALAATACLFLTVQAMAQFPPRPDDHFWRRKVVNRIDLNEKINAPLVKRENKFYTEGQYAEKEGLVMCLFNGLKAGKYVAYHPDSLSKTLNYDDVLKRIREIEGSLSGSGEDFDDELAGDGAAEGFSSFEGGAGDDGWGDPIGEDAALSPADDLSASVAPSAGSGYSGDFDPTPYENVLHFVEDRIFDKTRSDMVYDIQFVEIIWTDPGETLPEKPLCTFRYKDVMETLENTQWKNRFNDAEYKNFREIFEFRMFHSYIINVSGEGLRTLDEAEDRRQKLIEYEHHLWNY